MASNLPYLVFGIIYDTDGTTPLSGVRVRCRNESTAETLTPMDTVADGAFLFDVANFASGYNSTDNITVYLIYQNYEGSHTFSVAANENEANITVSLVTSSSDINYTTVQNVWDELDSLTSSDISAALIIKKIQRAEGEIDKRTETTFISSTKTNEIYAWNSDTGRFSTDMGRSQSNSGWRDFASQGGYDVLQVNNRPLLTITTLELNQAGPAATDSWNTISQQSGSGGDYHIIDLDIGLVQFINTEFPRSGARSIRLTYTYGYSTVPKTVERLATLMAVRDVIFAKLGRSQFDSVQDISIRGIRLQNKAGEAQKYVRGTLGDEIDRLWTEVIGSFKSDSR